MVLGVSVWLYFIMYRLLLFFRFFVYWLLLYINLIILLYFLLKKNKNFIYFDKFKCFVNGNVWINISNSFNVDVCVVMVILVCFYLIFIIVEYLIKFVNIEY